MLIASDLFLPLSGLVISAKVGHFSFCHIYCKINYLPKSFTLIFHGTTFVRGTHSLWVHFHNLLQYHSYFFCLKLHLFSQRCIVYGRFGFLCKGFYPNPKEFYWCSGLNSFVANPCVFIIPLKYLNQSFTFWFWQILVFSS